MNHFLLTEVDGICDAIMCDEPENVSKAITATAIREKNPEKCRY
jgi:hypothetical protein